MKWELRQKSVFKPFLELQQEKYKAIGIHPVMAEVLVNRGYNFDDINDLIFHPGNCLDDPTEMYGCEEAAKAILAAVEDKKDIYVFADYDVDGLTSGYVMTNYLRMLGSNVTVYYPERNEGYGLNLVWLQKIPKGSVVITVDNGVTALPGIRYCKDNDITIIVTDHHEPSENKFDIPICDPHLDPKGKGHHLCGAAVAWKLCMYMDKQLDKNEAWKLTPYAAIGTIADVMPMTLENMAIVKTGLEMIGKGFAPNVKRFFNGLDIKYPTAEDIGWKLAPRLNACGRMGNVNLAADFLFCNDNSELNRIILKINEVNETRKSISKEAITDALRRDYTYDTFCLYDATAYPSGIAGIVANSLVEKFDKPAIVYTRNNGSIWPASMRSNGFNILPYLEKQKQQSIIYNYGGHAQACGISLFPDIETFKTSLNGYLRIPFLEYKKKEPVTYVDAVITLEDVNRQLYNNVNLIPTDTAVFPKPVFMIRNLEVKGVSASRNNANNIKFTFIDDNLKLHDFWGWNKAAKYKELGFPSKVDIIGTLSSGFGKATKDIMLTVEDIRHGTTGKLR